MEFTSFPNSRAHRATRGTKSETVRDVEKRSNPLAELLDTLCISFLVGVPLALMF
jgi:hypothetical protein